MSPVAALPLVGIGLAAGVGSGLVGVGGGIVMVPLLVLVSHFQQHRAHATSLAAIIPLGLVGAATYALGGKVNYGFAALLVVGSLAGVPLGARVMVGSSEAGLRIAFGILLLVSAGALLLLP